MTLHSPSQLVRDGLAGRHPELSGEAVAALMWESGYSSFRLDPAKMPVALV